MTTAFSNAAFSTAFLTISLFISGVLGEFTCEQLDRSTCAFAVSSSGMRCVLEKHVLSRRKDEYTCRSSGFKATGVTGRIETDQCVVACGLDRDTFGISSDSLLDRWFMTRLCSPVCYEGCFNVFELYSNVAASEGVSLKNMCGCEENNRREMNEIVAIDESTVDTQSPESDPKYYNIGRLAADRKLVSVQGRDEGAAAPNPGQGSLWTLGSNRRLIFGQDHMNRIAAMEEAVAAPPA